MKRFERSIGLATALYKKLPLTTFTPTNSQLIVCQDVEGKSLPCLSIRKRELISVVVNKKNSAVCLLKCISSSLLICSVTWTFVDVDRLVVMP